MSELEPFPDGTIVRTIKGARFWGKAVSSYEVRPGEWRTDVLAIDPGFDGSLHVYPSTQLTAGMYPAPTTSRNEGVEVKALEWHPSELSGWNDDWHTISPIIYTVRCADENGWKWSSNGAHGYCATPEGAKAAAQANFERRILSALKSRGDNG